VEYADEMGYAKAAGVFDMLDWDQRVAELSGYESESM
jgi:hypothetical protein